MRAPFLVHQVPRTPATVLRYRRVFTQFSLRVRVSDYTWRTMIDDLLYSPPFGMYPGYAGSFLETLAVPGGAAENKVRL